MFLKTSENLIKTVCIPLSSPNALAFHLCQNIVNLFFYKPLLSFSINLVVTLVSSLLSHLFQGSCYTRSKAVERLCPWPWNSRVNSYCHSSSIVIPMYGHTSCKTVRH